jgi:GT2 family glycosyltransferase
LTVSVAAVVANYEGADLLPDCLDTLAGQTHAPAEVFVVDAGSTDDSVAVARRHGAHVVEAENRGLGYLYNRGVEAASTEYVLVANNDLAFDSDCVRELAIALSSRSCGFAADPMQYDWSGERVIHARTTLERAPLLRTPIPGLRLDPCVQADDISPTVTANAGAMLVHRARFLELGGFDERFFLDFEDLDLCWRAWLRGWESIYVPSARLRHKVGMSAGAKVTPRRLRGAHHNVLAFAVKCLPPGALARAVVGDVIRLPRQPRTLAPAMAAVLRELPALLRERQALRPKRALLSWFTAGQPG